MLVKHFMLFCIIVLIIVLSFTKEARDEGFFGMSQCVMDQLSSTRAPPVGNMYMTYDPSNELSFTRTTNKVDQEVEDLIQNNLTKKGIKDMTESGYEESNYTLL